MPTTQISLIREHTEATTPPRALWVPFELGRPLGVPNDPAFQTKVLLAALRLLEVPKGPVIEDFPEEAPESDEVATGWACPVSFTSEDAKPTDTPQLVAEFKSEITKLHPWYEIAVQKRGRTTVGVSGLDIEAIVDFLTSFIGGGNPENPREDIPLADTVRLAVNDLKAFYSEAVTAQPGQGLPGSAQLEDWFWVETTAARVLLALQEIWSASDDEVLQAFGQRLLVPATQVHRFS